MKKLFLLISLLFFSYSIYSQDTISAVVTDDSIVIRDNHAYRICGSRYVMSAYRNGNEITIIETDTIAFDHHARCDCIYNLHITLAPLPAGSYNVNVKYTPTFFKPDTIIVGTTTFSINKKKSASDTITIISHYQSACLGHDPISIHEIKNEKINLSSNPNPFYSKSSISFQLVKESEVYLNLYDYSGKKVASLINANMSKGKHEIEYNNQNLKSGIYFLSLITPEKSETIKFIVFRN
jgi:hypothetical protein